MNFLIYYHVNLSFMLTRILKKKRKDLIGKISGTQDLRSGLIHILKGVQLIKNYLAMTRLNLCLDLTKAGKEKRELLGLPVM